MDDEDTTYLQQEITVMLLVIVDVCNPCLEVGKGCGKLESHENRFSDALQHPESHEQAHPLVQAFSMRSTSRKPGYLR